MPRASESSSCSFATFGTDDKRRAGRSSPIPTSPTIDGDAGNDSHAGTECDAVMAVRPERRMFLLSAAGFVAVAATTAAGGRTLRSRFSASSSRKNVTLPAPAVPLAPAAPAVTSTVPGISSFYTSNANFYRIDTAVEVPQVSAASWQLRIHGMVDHEVRLSFDDVLARTLVGEDVILTCVSNTVGGSLTGTARWLGARLKDLRRSGREPRCEPTGRPIDQRVDVGIPDRGAGRQTPGTARDRHER